MLLTIWLENHRFTQFNWTLFKSVKHMTIYLLMIKGAAIKIFVLICHFFFELINNNFHHFVLQYVYIYCIMQQGFHSVSITIYQYFSWLEFKWHNDLETRHPWIWMASACGLVDSDFTNDTFFGHYPIRNSNHIKFNRYKSRTRRESTCTVLAVSTPEYLNRFNSGFI